MKRKPKITYRIVSICLAMMLGLSLSSALSISKVSAAENSFYRPRFKSIEQYCNDSRTSPMDEYVIEENVKQKLKMYVGDFICIPFKYGKSYSDGHWAITTSMDSTGRQSPVFELGIPEVTTSNKKVVRVDDDEWDKALYAKKLGKCTVTYFWDDLENRGNNGFVHHLHIIKYKITVVKQPKLKTKVYSCSNNKSEQLNYVVAVTNTSKRTLTSIDVNYTLKKNEKKIEKGTDEGCRDIVLPPKKTIYIPIETEESADYLFEVYRCDGEDAQGQPIKTFVGSYPEDEAERICRNLERDGVDCWTEETLLHDISGYTLSVNNVGSSVSSCLYPLVKTKTKNTSGKIKSRIKNIKIKKDRSHDYLYYLGYKYKPFKTGKKCIENRKCVNFVCYDKNGKIIDAKIVQNCEVSNGFYVECDEKPTYKIFAYGYQINKK